MIRSREQMHGASTASQELRQRCASTEPQELPSFEEIRGLLQG